MHLSEYIGCGLGGATPGIVRSFTYQGDRVWMAVGLWGAFDWMRCSTFGLPIPEVVRSSPRIVRDIAISLHRADLLLNIAPSTIAAWKAHATRGTYRRAA